MNLLRKSYVSASQIPFEMKTIYLALDTDWCHDEVLDYALSLFVDRGLQCTVFATGPYQALQNNSAAEIEVGLHPNFMDCISQDYERKLLELRAFYPHAQGVSCHATMSSVPLLDLFKRHGLAYDRSLLLYKHDSAAPFYHYNGLLRIPVYWEDDIWFTAEPGTRFSAQLLRTDEFDEVFVFHPIHLYQNTLSQAHYQAFKPLQRDLSALAEHRGTGYGAHSFFSDLADNVSRSQIRTGLLSELLT